MTEISHALVRKSFVPHFNTLKILLPIFGVGLIILILSTFLNQPGSMSPEMPILTVIGVLLVLPFFVFSYVLCILHWKDRYIGRHSNIWGVILLLEVSGWTKLIYFFRHILSDMNLSLIHI